METGPSPPPDMPRIDQVVLLTTAAQELHRSRQMIAKMIAKRQLEAWKVDDRLWVVSKSSLRAALDRQKRREASGPDHQP